MNDNADEDIYTDVDKWMNTHWIDTTAPGDKYETMASSDGRMIWRQRSLSTQREPNDWNFGPPPNDNEDERTAPPPAPDDDYIIEEERSGNDWIVPFLIGCGVTTIFVVILKVSGYL